MATFSEIIKSETPTLVDFYADWCGPCRNMAPIMDQLKQKMGDRVRVLKINVDKNEALANQLNIRGVPTFILYKNGEIKWRQSGGMSLSAFENVIGMHS